MVYSPIPTAYPSIPSGVWTKVNTRNPETKKYSLIVNNDPANDYRFLKLTPGLTSTYVNATYGATAGKILPGGMYANDEETKENLSVADIWVYQASGVTLTSLSVDEGV